MISLRDRGGGTEVVRMASAPVVIIGGGPVGMVLAMHLAVFGVPW
jgi:cation diffusion facilitator CzcD-associated flavoprotein CzcO